MGKAISCAIDELILLGKETRIPVCCEGKISTLPLDWWMRHEIESRLMNVEGDPLFVASVGTKPAVLITASSWNGAGNPEAIIGVDAYIKLWSYKRSERWLRAADIRTGMQLEGRYGMFVVAKAKRVSVPLWQVNVKEAHGMCVAGYNPVEPAT